VNGQDIFPILISFIWIAKNTQRISKLQFSVHLHGRIAQSSSAIFVTFFNGKPLVAARV
jgi:hypothetical protein